MACCLKALALHKELYQTPAPEHVLHINTEDLSQDYSGKGNRLSAALNYEPIYKLCCHALLCLTGRKAKLQSM